MIYKSKVKGILPLWKYPATEEQELLKDQRQVCEIKPNDIFMLVAIKKVNGQQQSKIFLKFLVKDCAGWIQTSFEDLESPICNKFFEEICQQD